MKQENKIQQEHQKNMKQYQKKYDNTKKEVLHETSILSGNAKIKVLIGLVGIAVIFYILAASNADNIKQSFDRWTMGRHQDEVVSTIKEYVANGEYAKLVSYCEENHIYEEKGKFAKYYPVMSAAHKYGLVSSSIRSFESLHENNTDDLEWVSEITIAFYRSLNTEEYDYIPEADNEENQEMLTKMKKDMDQILKERLNLQDEDLQNIAGMTSAKLKILMGERYFGNEN